MAYSVEVLKSKRRDAKDRRRDYIRRRDAINQPYDNGFRMDDYFSRIKKKTDDCASELENGIKGMASVVNGKCDALVSRTESRTLSSQAGFSVALSCMYSEIVRCQENIEYYERKIADYDRQIKEQGGVILPWE